MELVNERSMFCREPWRALNDYWMAQKFIRNIVNTGVRHHPYTQDETCLDVRLSQNRHSTTRRINASEKHFGCVFRGHFLTVIAVHKCHIKPLQDRTQGKNKRTFSARGAVISTSCYDQSNGMAYALSINMGHKATGIAPV